MDDWIIRVLQGNATAEEKERLRRWRDESPANERRFQELEKLWGLAERGRPLSDARTIPDYEELIGRAESAERVTGLEPGSPEPQRARRRRYGGGVRRPARSMGGLHVAATAALFIAVGVVLGSFIGGAGPSSMVLAEGEIATGTGEMTTITLGDGSSIRLGPQSRLRLGEEGENHVAWIEGRAFFGIKHDPSRRFTVRTPHGEAVVLGTRFEVRSEEDGFRVLVVEGRLRVSAGDGVAEVAEGEMAEGGPDRLPTTSTVDDVYVHLAWMGNALVFQGTPLRRALTEIGRWYDETIVLEDETLGDVAITATFTDHEVDVVILTVCEVVGARCSRDVQGEFRVGRR